MPARRTVQLVQRLWRQAEQDLVNAERIVQPGGYYVAASLAHQAAEKSLKAAHWHLRGEEPPCTHDVRSLAERLVERREEIPPSIHAAVALLAPMHERACYPSARLDEPIPVDLFGECDAQNAIRSAKEVMPWVRQLLLRPPGRTERQTDS
jgi:HEPN domain-containing protein